MSRRLVFFADVVFRETFKNGIYFVQRFRIGAGAFAQSTGALNRSPTLVYEYSYFKNIKLWIRCMDFRIYGVYSGSRSSETMRIDDVWVTHHHSVPKHPGFWKMIKISWS